MADGSPHELVVWLGAADEMLDRLWSLPNAREALVPYERRLAELRTGTGDLDERLRAARTLHASLDAAWRSVQVRPLDELM